MNNLNLSEEEVQSLSYQERSKLLNMNLVRVARHFQFRVEVFFKEIVVDGPSEKISIMMFELNSKLKLVHICTHFYGF